MSSFDPSIISLSEPLSEGTNHKAIDNSGDNAITKFLQEAEFKRAQELENDQSLKEETPTSEIIREAPMDIPERKSNYPDFSNTNKIVYMPEFLFKLKDSPLVVVPTDLPPKSYYRMRPVKHQSAKKEWYNSNRNIGEGHSTGTMGNFSLKKTGNERGFGGRHALHGRGQRERNHRKQNDDDHWLAELEKDEPIGTSAEDFERWKAKAKSAERRRRGEADPAEVANLENEGPKNTIDSFFSLSNPVLNKKPETQAPSTPDVGKSSKFFSFFKAEELTNNNSTNNDQANAANGKDGVSKILSLLDNNITSQSNDSSSPGPETESSGQQRSQFFNDHTPSLPLVAPIQQQQQERQLPILSQKQENFHGGAKDSFFLSLLNKGEKSKSPAPGSPQLVEKSDKKSKHSKAKQSDPLEKSQSTPQNEKPSPETQVPSQARAHPGTQSPQLHLHSQPTQPQQRQSQHQRQEQSLGYPPLGNQGIPLPPGFQNIPPGLPQQLIAQQLQAGNMDPALGSGPFPPPPGFPQQLPPWIAQQQFPPQGRFMPPPPQGYPGQLRQPVQGGADQKEDQSRGGYPPMQMFGQGPMPIPPHLLANGPGPNGSFMIPPQADQRYPAGFVPSHGLNPGEQQRNNAGA